MKRVTLVFPTKVLPHAFFGFILPPLGIERIAAQIEDVAHVEILDIRFEDDIIAVLKKSNPDIIGINIKSTMQAESNYEVAKLIRNEFPGVPIVMGGLHATHCYEEALEFSDFVIRGEGELSFRDFVLDKPKDSIAGLCYKKEGKVIANPLGSPMTSLDQLKLPARHLRKKHYHYGVYPLIKMDLLETSRGCTHFCTFCSPAATYPARYRMHSAEYVFEDIKNLYAQGVQYCWISDDHLGGDLVRLEKICDLIIGANIKMAFFCFIRPFLGKMDLKRKMACAGFISISYGAESPDLRQLTRYGKGHPVEASYIKNANSEFREAGIVHIGNSYVFGDPMDSKETIAFVGKYARSLGPNSIEPLYSQPFPGTRYREELKEAGLLLERPWRDFTEARMLVKHPQLSEEELLELRIKVWLDFLSPKRFFMQMSVPIYLFQKVKVPRLKVLKFMKRTEKSIFGCFLEDKIYRHRYEEMIYDYFHKYLPTFEPDEMDFTASFEDLMDLCGLNFLKKWLSSKTVQIRVTDGNRIPAEMLLHFKNDRLASAYALAGKSELSPGIKKLEFHIPLKHLSERLASESPLTQKRAEIFIVIHNLLTPRLFKNMYHFIF